MDKQNKYMDYTFLREKIFGKLKTCKAFSEALGISTQCLSQKLNGNQAFSQKQIDKTIEVLSLTNEEAIKCFFTTKKVE